MSSRFSEISLERVQSLAHFGLKDLDFTNNPVTLSIDGVSIYGMTGIKTIHLKEEWISFIHPD